MLSDPNKPNALLASINTYEADPQSCEKDRNERIHNDCGRKGTAHAAVCMQQYKKCHGTMTYVAGDQCGNMIYTWRMRGWREGQEFSCQLLAL